MISKHVMIANSCLHKYKNHCLLHGSKSITLNNGLKISCFSGRKRNKPYKCNTIKIVVESFKSNFLTVCLE